MTPVNIELTSEQVVVSELQRLIVIYKEFRDENGFSVVEKEDLDYTLKEEFVDFCNRMKIDHTRYW